MNTSTQPPEGAGRARSRAGELTLGLMSGEERAVYAAPAFDFVGAGLPAKAACQPTHFSRLYWVQLWELACLRRRPDSRPISPGCTGSNCGSEACPRRRPDSRPISPGCTGSNCGSWLACEGGLTADPYLSDALSPIVGARLAREGGLTADLSLPDVLGQIVGVSLLAMAQCQSISLLDVRQSLRAGSLPQGG